MAKKMERSALDKLLSRSHLTETFQGDEAGAHKDDTTFPSKESAAPTPGPQGEDVPTTTTSSPPSPPGQGDAVTRDETEIPSHPRRGPGFLTLIGYLYHSSHKEVLFNYRVLLINVSCDFVLALCELFSSSLPSRL